MSNKIADLIVDIEKRMVSLGYEDLEELDACDNDLHALKELKSRLMSEQREAKEAKKERTKSIKLLRDFIVKISKICKKDMCIYNGKYILPGKITMLELKMKFMFEIKEPYNQVINDILRKEEKNEWIYISDISILKEIIDEYPENKEKILPACEMKGIICNYHDSDKEFKSFDDELDEHLDEIRNDADKMIELVIPFDDPEIVGIKKIFHIKYGEYPDIDVNIQLFPYLMDKGCGTLEFVSGIFYEKEGDLTMYYARVRIPFSHFDVYMKFIYF